MKRIIPFAAILVFLLFSCRNAVNIESVKTEIFDTEKAFEAMVAEKGMAEGFWYFADENAVILRGNDSIISGKDGIRNYYEKRARPDVKVTWTPDYINVSDDGTLGYTYGKYTYFVPDSTGKITELKGIFHTVWKKTDHGWKYMWD
ncbi:MAG: nuclear transport factor 2 family protein [Bacteroidales bacterium]|jgi:ketosteroid isomerase-like protein|nr:nuclear transport factor 2 family protein [Bacteroidales bacterium]